MLGIKDTNDHLVAVTLRSLADLVPMLGSAVVIGGKRAKLFNDGLPIAHKPSSGSRRSSARVSLHHIPAITSQNESDVLSNSSGTEIPPDLILNERPSPDGEEGDTSTITDEGLEDNQLDVEDSVGFPNNEVWDDWDINDVDNNDATSSQGVDNIDSITNFVQLSSMSLTGSPNDQNGNTHANHNNRKAELPDILELDIKNVKNGENSEEFDFFQDMEPVINTTSKFLISEDVKAMQEDESDGYRNKKIVDVSHTSAANISSTLDWSVNVNAEHQEEGWGDDLDGWD